MAPITLCLNQRPAGTHLDIHGFHLAQLENIYVEIKLIKEKSGGKEKKKPGLNEQKSCK